MLPTSHAAQHTDSAHPPVPVTIRTLSRVATPATNFTSTPFPEWGPDTQLLAGVRMRGPQSCPPTARGSVCVFVIWVNMKADVSMVTWPGSLSTLLTQRHDFQCLCKAAPMTATRAEPCGSDPGWKEWGHWACPLSSEGDHSSLTG